MENASFIQYSNIYQFDKLCVTPSESALCKFQRFRQTRIETIQRCPPGTCVRVENEVISLHNSPRWNPQNRYIYTTRLHESRIQIYRTKIQITLKTIERPATDKMQMGLRALKNNQWRPQPCPGQAGRVTLLTTSISKPA